MARRTALGRYARRYLRYPLEGLAAALAFAVFWSLPLDSASALGGWLGRAIGPRLRLTRRAEANLRRALPHLSEPELARIVRGMWDNLGRVLAEYPHLSRFQLCDGGDRVEVIGAQYADLLRDDGIGGILFSAHFGNWELASIVATQLGLPLTHVYRAANNPFIERLIRGTRRAIAGSHWPKGPGTARELVAALKSGAHLAVLADQKLREGIAVPFFGHQAMTAPLIAKLALRFDCPVVPARVERTRGARFRLTIFPPLEVPASGDREADVLECMRRVNALIEAWIRERPEQWFWLHRRWPDDERAARGGH